MRNVTILVVASVLLALLPQFALAQLYEFGGKPVEPPAGTPICSDWYRQVALPKLGCHPETIEKICSGQLPKLEGAQATVPYCGGYEKPGYNTTQYGKTCQTTAGQCQLPAPAALTANCLCTLPGGSFIKGWVTTP